MRAPSTLGSFLRSFTWGNARQLEAVHREFLAELACRTPLLPGKDVLAFVDIDSQQKRVFGYQKQGAAFGFTKIGGKSLLVRGLNVLAAAISTPLAAPVIAGVRLRGGSAASARGAASFVTEAVGDPGTPGAAARSWSGWTRRITAGGHLAVRRAGAHFSVTAQLNPSVKAAIAAIPPAPGRRSLIPGRCGMTSWAAGLRRRGRRGEIHRVHRPPAPRPGAGAAHRPADRPPGPRHEHQSR